MIDFNQDHFFSVPLQHTVHVSPEGATCSSLTLYFTDDTSTPQTVFTKLDDRVPVGERPQVRYDDEPGAPAQAAAPEARPTR